MSDTRPKVFGIGFHKTGTTSLAFALRDLGYRVTGPNGVRRPGIADEVHELAASLVPKFDAFQDNPWPILFRQLDRDYPGSKFILTLRPEEKWIASILRHFAEEDTPMREWIYGAGHGHPAGHEEVYLARYRKHNADVLAHFAERPGDLLVLRLTEGDGWEKLCPFLGEDVPDKLFPHANTAAQRDYKRSTPRSRQFVHNLLRRVGLRS